MRGLPWVGGCRAPPTAINLMAPVCSGAAQVNAALRAVIELAVNRQARMDEALSSTPNNRKDKVMPSEPRFQPTELDQIHADIRKLMAETMRLSTEVSKPPSQSKQLLMMVVVGLSSAIGGAIGATLTLLFKFH
jgi:hypothetical protein